MCQEQGVAESACDQRKKETITDQGPNWEKGLSWCICRAAELWNNYPSREAAGRGAEKLWKYSGRLEVQLIHLSSLASKQR